MAENQLSKSQREWIAIAITCIIGWIFTWLATAVFEGYALGLFIWLPMVLGAVSTLVFAYKNEVTKRECRNVSILSLTLCCLGMLVFALEGVVCLVMAAPIGIFFSWIGHSIAWKFVLKKELGSLLSVVVLVMSVPVVMGFEYLTKDEEELLKPIVTSIEINAPVEKVWENVTAFPQLKEPIEFIFKTGIAYPINAEIIGTGIGAVRHCNFSTGSFVEPITVWDKPRLLKFDVADQPEPMKEISFYDLHPNHLHGYFVSKQGQFKLSSLSDGHTLLEGTTWYYNKIQPNAYWTLWSDYIIHKIHKRVLAHIKEQAEKG